MIVAPEQALGAFVDRLRDAVQVAALPPEKLHEFEEFAASVRLREFPGAILAWPRTSKPTVYYAIANDAAEWRRLRPLLLAFAGPTLTSFTGRIEPLLPKIAVESLLISSGWPVVARLVASSDPKAQEIASRSLRRMIQMVTSAPPTTREVPRPTSQLLAQFVDCLNGNDRQQASAILDTCREELRLDALNLLFLQIQLLAHFGEWHAICEMPEFSSLCHTRKPKTVAVAMLESLYRCHLGSLLSAPDIAVELSVWRERIRPVALPLLRLPIPHMVLPGALRLYGLAALDAAPRQPALEAALRDFAGRLGNLWDALLQVDHADNGVMLPTPLPVQQPATVQDALIAAEEADTLGAIAAALKKVGELSDDERAKLLKSESFRSIFQSLQNQTLGQTPPTAWVEWVQRLGDPEFKSSYETMQHAIVEWPAQSIRDTTEIDALSDAIACVPDKPPAGPRLADALPSLAAWVANDPDFPRPGMLPVYDALMFHLVAGSRRAAKTYESASILVRALFSIGLPAPQYAALLDDCLELAGVGVGTRGIYWLLDVLDETIANSAPDPGKRDAFWSTVHARLIPLRNHLTPGQILAIRRLAGALGWNEACAAEVLPEAGEADALGELRDALAGKTVAIYSLTEAATRQAEMALLEMVPDIRISVSHDLVGTNALKGMAQNADIFVVATASAKHAATGFIQQCRPREKPILYAAGRGFSSIVRAIEDYVLQRAGAPAPLQG